MKSPLILLITFILCISPIYGENLLNVGEEQESITFKTHIQPIFQKHCLSCHKSRFLSQGGLRLNSVKLFLKGGDSGPAVIPGQPDKSLIVNLITADKDSERRMPPEGNKALNPEEILLIKEWIQQGVK